MADHDDLHRGPQRQAIPAMLIFIGAIVVLAIGILLWFMFGN